MIELHHGDCLDTYGTTQNKWDSIISLEPLWGEYKRVCKGAVVLTAAQPFTSLVVASNFEGFSHEWVWGKTTPTGHLNAKKKPMRIHEDCLVFLCKFYNPQGLTPFNKVTRRGGNGGNFGVSGRENFQEFTNYPRSIIKIPTEGKTTHPTQKPVALMEYLIRTYSNEGDTILDNVMGSGTTGIACINTKREFIGIEKDPDYFQKASTRIWSHALGV